MENVVERKAVCWSKGENDRVLGGGSLEFEVELTAETFAQRESPGTIQTAAKRRVQDQLHTAAVVKEPLQHEILLRRHHAQNNLRSCEILNNLFRSQPR